MKDKNKPVRKEHMNLYRVLSLIAIVIATLGMTAVLCAQNHFFIDEWLCLFLLERRRKSPFLSPAEAQRKKQPKRMTSEEIYEKSQSNDGISGDAVSRISASAQCSDSAADRGGSPFSAAQ